jgi:hypothetical protein
MKKLAMLIFFCPALVCAQVKIMVPERQYKSRDKINVAIINTGTSEITYCLEAGYISYIDPDHSEPSPTPVYVQQKTSRGWGTLMSGPDIGSSVHPEILGPGETQHFPFRVNAHGTVRVVLVYKLGSDAHFCQERKGKRIARSREFSIE